MIAMRVFDRMRLLWREFKEPVQNGSAGCLRRLVVLCLRTPVSILKRIFPTTSVIDRALYLMYHPECGFVACDAYKAIDISLGRSETVASRKRFQADMNRVVKALRLHRTRLCDLPLPAHIKDAIKVAVHVHIFYPKEGRKIMERLHFIPCPFDLFVSAPDGIDLSFISYPCKVIRCENRGRDMMPFVCLLSKELSTYDYVCHLHTKRSPHIRDQRGWFDFLMESLLPDSDGIMRVFNALENGAGVVSAGKYLKTEDPSGWGRNRDAAQILLTRLDAPKEISESPLILFPEGSMAWFKGATIAMLNSMGLRAQDFPPEPIPADGTLAHVLERLLYVVSMKAGFYNVEMTCTDVSTGIESANSWSSLSCR